MHILKALLLFQSRPAARNAAFSRVDSATGRGIAFSQGDRIHWRGSKSKSANRRGIILSQCNTFYHESDIGNRFVTKDVFIGS